MEKVLGLGGVFIRARDRAALADWYRDHLGLAIDGEWFGTVLPEPAADGSGGIWSAFAEDTEYFGLHERQFMVNFRVADRDAILSQLRAAGCDVDEATEDSDFGRFGWVTDPEGNRVELWEPPAEPPA
jgi:predicted enzyme related to lactoylglutathione lyase